MGKGQVAGILQCLGSLLAAVSLVPPTMEPLGSAGDLLCTAAVKRGIQRNRSGVQGCCHGQHLEGGAGLVTVADAAVSPLLQLCSFQSLCIG